MKKKALIVDDIPNYVETLEIFLEDDFDIIKQFSFTEAMNSIKQTNFDLAIIDIRLDEEDDNNFDGIKLVKTIHQKSKTTAVIVMSAYQSFEYAVEALNAGADYFLRKPIEPDELEGFLLKLFSSKHTKAV